MRGALLLALAACAPADAGIALHVHETPIPAVPMRTKVGAGGTFGVSSPVPARAADCAAAGWPAAWCADADGDGLADGWEDAALFHLDPVVRLHPDDGTLYDPAGAVGAVGRVAPGPEVDHVRVYIMLGYNMDYGRCGVGGHHGDSERVALDLVLAPGAAEVVGVYTAAHEYSRIDHGARIDLGGMRELSFMDDPRTGAPRWVVFSALDKHATYLAAWRCSSVATIACQKDYCNDAPLPETPGPTDAIFPIVNAGEPARPRLADLAVVGFPGDVPFGAQEFCGGLRVAPCSSPVAEKLLRDPFLERAITP